MRWPVYRFKLPRWLSSTASSPLSVFLGFLVAIYIIKGIGTGDLLGKQQDTSNVDQIRSQALHIVEYADELMVRQSTAVGSLKVYDSARSRLQPIYVNNDKFLQAYGRSCESSGGEDSVGKEDSMGEKESNLPLCPCVPPILYGRLPTPLESPTWERVFESQSDFLIGGEWRPHDCRARERVALIIPYRDREDHLRLLLYHSLDILKRQLLHFRVFLVEQSRYGRFNKALIMNAAFLEVERKWAFDCVIFHDVDMLLEDDRSIYACTHAPRHLGVYVDKFRYKLAYPELFGGAVAMRRNVFRSVNGYANTYFGWGGEDDDMFFRLQSIGYSVERYPKEISRYKMIPHSTDKGNPVSLKRSRSVDFMTQHMASDGLNSIAYLVMNITETSIYTHILVRLGCPMKEKPLLGHSRTEAYESHVVNLDACKLKCSRDVTCKAITWSLNTNQCHLHSKLKKPNAESGWMYFERDCSKVEQ